MTKLSQQLRRPLPKKAIKENLDTGMSAINPAYVMERLNDVFGEAGWEANFEVIEQGQHIVVRCNFVARVPGSEQQLIKRCTFGGNTNSDRGDAYKGACTDALTKAASQIGIASAVYKGQYDAEPAARSKPVAPADLIGSPELNALWNAAKRSGKTSDAIGQYLKKFGITAFASLPKQHYSEVLAWALAMEAA